MNTTINSTRALNFIELEINIFKVKLLTEILMGSDRQPALDRVRNTVSRSRSFNSGDSMRGLIRPSRIRLVKKNLAFKKSVLKQ